MTQTAFSLLSTFSIQGFARHGAKRLLVYELLSGGDVHRRRTGKPPVAQAWTCVWSCVGQDTAELPRGHTLSLARTGLVLILAMVRVIFAVLFALFDPAVELHSGQLSAGTAWHGRIKPELLVISINLTGWCGVGRGLRPVTPALRFSQGLRSAFFLLFCMCGVVIATCQQVHDQHPS